MNLIDKIKSGYPLEDYIPQITGREWKKVGIWQDLGECPFCGHKDFFFKDERVYCFACQTHAGDSIQFRSKFENISYKDAVDKFRQELGIKKWDKKDIEWIALRERACEYMHEILFTCQTKYKFGDKSIIPLHYLTDIRKHSYEAIMHFRIGFNDGTLIQTLEKEYSKDVLKASGILSPKGFSIIPKGCFTFPFLVSGEIKYFRIKDPNHIYKAQMPLVSRSRNAIWFNQDVIQNGNEIWVTEGEDDVISLWDLGVNAVGTVGPLGINHTNYLKSFELPYIYLCFDNDKIMPEKPVSGGQHYTQSFLKSYDNINTFLINIPEGKDIDDLIREAEDKEALLLDLRATADKPTAEMKSLIRESPDGYYISRSLKDRSVESKLTNWIFELEAVIVSEDTRERKGKIKKGTYQTTVYIPGSVLARVSEFREFLYNNADQLLHFTGNDNDLNVLVQYWDVAFSPKIVRKSECVGEIEEGFIAENIFISNSDEFKPLVNGFLSLDEKHSIKIEELVQKGGNQSEIPYFPLTEPLHGIDNFKKNVFDLMVKNRRLKVAIAIGWMKAVLWSKMFYNKKKWFPILMLHGKKESGKSVMANWLMSMIGLRDCLPEFLAPGGTSGVGLSRKLAYYSSLPVFVDDYGKNKEISDKFHSFFVGIFNRSSSTKGIKEDFGVRRVIIRGCMLLAGEYCPNDPALASRIVSIELTERERNTKYYKDLLKLEPQFACIGLDWLKRRNVDFERFMVNYDSIESQIANDISSPRQASVWAVCLAAVLTEPFFKKDELIPFAIRLANQEIEERKGEELIGTLWEATGVLLQRNAINPESLYFDSVDSLLEVHLPSLISEIKGSPFTRHYVLPNHREVAKILKQEPYVIEMKTTRVNKGVAKRWILNLDLCPDSIKDMYKEPKTKKEEEDDV